MKRYKMSKGKSKKVFRKTAGLQHRYNTLNPIQRGGTRL